MGWGRALAIIVAVMWLVLIALGRVRMGEFAPLLLWGVEIIDPSLY
jgi:hypothetical protein